MNQSTRYTIQVTILGVLVVLYFTIVAFVIDKGTLRFLASGTIFFSIAWLALAHKWSNARQIWRGR